MPNVMQFHWERGDPNEDRQHGMARQGYEYYSLIQHIAWQCGLYDTLQSNPAQLYFLFQFVCDCGDLFNISA